MIFSTWKFFHSATAEEVQSWVPSLPGPLLLPISLQQLQAEPCGREASSVSSQQRPTTSWGVTAKGQPVAPGMGHGTLPPSWAHEEQELGLGPPRAPPAYGAMSQRLRSAHEPSRADPWSQFTRRTDCELFATGIAACQEDHVAAASHGA